jgi:hypothetical protein
MRNALLPREMCTKMQLSTDNVMGLLEDRCGGGGSQTAAVDRDVDGGYVGFVMLYNTR